jgi:hypothetical protein
LLIVAVEAKPASKQRVAFSIIYYSQKRVDPTLRVRLGPLRRMELVHGLKVRQTNSRPNMKQPIEKIVITAPIYTLSQSTKSNQWLFANEGAMLRNIYIEHRNLFRRRDGPCNAILQTSNLIASVDFNFGA